MAGEALEPEHAPVRLCGMSADVMAAVLLDGLGDLVGRDGLDEERATAVAAAGRELIAVVDAAAPGDPPEEVEAQVARGAVFAVRRPRWTLLAVSRRSALSSLVRWDMRAVLSWLEAEA